MNEKEMFRKEVGLRVRMKRLNSLIQRMMECREKLQTEINRLEKERLKLEREKFHVKRRKKPELEALWDKLLKKGGRR